MIRPPVYSDMLQNYYENAFRKVREERQKRLAAIDTPEDARAYADWAKATVRAAFGTWPERTPLNFRVTAKAEADGVITEAVLFDSLPDFPVSASLFRPAKIEGKLPGVIGLCGHATEAKLAVPYHTFARSLAGSGCVVLLIDPIGQGERFQFGTELDQNLCGAHNQIGKMLALFGDHFGRWRVWDAMRGLDLLESLPEVDSNCLGVTGNSGGGTLSTYLWALDDRLKMAAPACYITSFYHNFDNELPVDAEQVIPGLAAAGFEMSDFLIARAPERCIVLGKSNDFFDPRGTAEAVREAGRIYELLGAKEKFAFDIEEGDHGYTAGNRKAMYRFFRQQEVGELAPGPELLARPEGRRVPQMLAERCDAPYETLPVPEFIRYDLNLEAPAAAPDYKVLRNGRAGDKKVSIYGLRSEPGILAFLHTLDGRDLNLVPAGETATLLVAGRDAESELTELNSKSGRIFALDVRGFGKSFALTSDRDGDFYSPYGTEFFYNAAGVMLNLPLFSGRARDVLAALKLLRENGYTRVEVIGRGLSSVFTLFACAAAPELWDSLTLEDAPASMKALVRNGLYRELESFAPRGMLRYFDLPEVCGYLNSIGKKVEYRK